MSFLASFSSIIAAVFSAKVAKSPSPIIRLTIRSGIKTSKSATFSPTPINLKGIPICFAIPKAIPPLVSASNFDKITPLIPKTSLKLAAVLTPS